MKTTRNFKTFFVTMVIVMTGIVSVSAQNSSEYFFDKKRNDSGQMISKTKYEFVAKGLAQAVYKSEYKYDEMNRLVKEELYGWNETKEQWQIVSCVNRIYSDKDNRMEMEYQTWNPKTKTYNEVSDKATYWYDNTGNILSYFMSKKNINTFEEFTFAN